MLTNRKRAFKDKDYLRAETGAIIKSHRGLKTVALIYPNTYYLGMSNLGFQSLYALFNADDGVVCERAFLPDELILNDQYRQPLKTLESGRPVHDFDCVALSISFENDYLNLLNILNLAQIPFHAKDRADTDPIVLAGGAAITINPEPIRAFCDLLFIGEAEEAIAEMSAVLKSSLTRSTKIAKLAEIEGVSACEDMDFSHISALPASVCPANQVPNSLEERVSLAHLRLYKRRVPKDINGFPIETIIHTPYSEFGKLSLIEVQRGCGRGCKFCAEGFIYTPFRQRDISLLKDQVLRGLKYRNKIGLIGADLLVYPHIAELFDFIHKNGGTFSPSSVRVDGLTDEIIHYLQVSEHRTLAIAPEAGSDDLRFKTNKKFNNENILAVVEKLVKAGIRHIKMYFMIGLPFERDQDIHDMMKLVDEARAVIHSLAKTSKSMAQLTMSLNPFIPKPRTPYQNGVFAGIAPLTEKIDLIRKTLLPKGSIRIYAESPFYAYIQALLSNGQAHVSQYLLAVFNNHGGLKRALKEFEYGDKKVYRRA